MSPRLPHAFDAARSRVIDKQAVSVEIVTREARIAGDIHVMINHRPSDVLNDASGFIAVTRAVITPHDGSGAEEHPFIALNKRAILYLRELPKPPQ